LTAAPVPPVPSLPPGLIVAAPASGSGKTTVTLGLLRRLAADGVRVASLKVGPDYIDPAFHAAAGGGACRNLDLWAMRPATVGAVLADVAAGRPDLVVVEGVMGLFDGAADGTGSTADVAAATGWPVVLVVDVRGQAASVAALVRGFASHRPEVRIAGVVVNRVGGAKHRRLIAAAMAALGVPVLGWLARDAGLALPARHLGLVQAVEHADLDGFLDRAAARIGAETDLAALRALAEPGRPPAAANGAPGLAPPGQRIALAHDPAFAFVYPHVTEAWRRAGAEIVAFSPLADQAPDPAADAVWLPGGYPELHAGRLAAAARFKAGLAAARDRGAAVVGECGGFMVLGRGLVDAEGTRHAMAGLLPVETSFAERRLHLGYRRARLAADGPLGAAGTMLAGHEFHYAALTDPGTDPGPGLGPGGAEPLFATVEDAEGADLGPVGARIGAVCGSFLHLVDRA
jgi:cobyrinic acid a,c-diamide synthase